MPSKELLNAVENYELYLTKHGVDETVVNAYVEAVKTAFLAEKDISYGLVLSERCKGLIHSLIRIGTNGGDFKFLEEWSQKHKEEVELINQYYDILRLEASYKVDSYKLYIERDRKRQDRFYEPNFGSLT